MLGMSLIWHGVLLNDLAHIPKPEYLFFLLLTLVYLCMGFALTFLYNYLKFGIRVKMRGSLIGGAFGFFIYLVAFVLGISFKGEGAEHIIVDFLWQMVEQGIGGAVIGFVFAMAERRDKIIDPNS